MWLGDRLLGKTLVRIECANTDGPMKFFFDDENTLTIQRVQSKKGGTRVVATVPTDGGDVEVEIHNFGQLTPAEETMRINSVINQQREIIKKLRTQLGKA